MAEPGKKRILLVCMGNICRSPIAEGVLIKKLENIGLKGFVNVDSAGTHGNFAGEPPDPRAVSAAHRRGYDIKGLRARKIRLDDFRDFDLVLAMDRDILACLLEICPPVYRSRLRLFLSYARGLEVDEVPDPYYGGMAGFEVVTDLAENAVQGLLDALQRGSA